VGVFAFFLGLPLGAFDYFVKFMGKSAAIRCNHIMAQVQPSCQVGGIFQALGLGPGFGWLAR
jgi:hypothetical protein